LPLQIQATPLYDNFQRLHKLLSTTPRIDEGKGRPPALLIDLERLQITQ
jgi:hypothetical protein